MEKHFGQDEKSVFFKQLDTCCQHIADKIGKPHISEWKNSDYVGLSALLYRQTKVAISGSTLKRIFGKLRTTARYYPQKATRDALAQFIGYRDWYEFELVNAKTDISATLSHPAKVKSVQLPNKAKKYGFLYIAIIGLILVSSGIIWYLYTKSNTIVDVSLICINPIGKTPHSAIFKLSKNVDKRSLTDFSIKFGDNKSPGIFTDSLINHYYETPGRYFAVLYHGNTPIDTTSVYLQSEGWSTIAEIANDTTRVYPILGASTADNKTPETNMEGIFHAGVDTNRTFFLYYANVKPTTIEADNFELNAYIKTSPDRAGVRCSQVDIIIYGEYDYHHLMLIKPACVAWSHCKLSENIRYGGKDDLRQLGHDLSKGGNVKLKIVDKSVRLFVNDSLAMQSAYHQPIGKLMGIKLMFGSLGTFSELHLVDLKTKQSFLP